MSTFISNCGGILGLFMGASLLSIVEIIYYFTLRLYFKLRQQRPVQSNREAMVRRNSIGVQVDVDNDQYDDESNELSDGRSIQLEALSVQSLE